MALRENKIGERCAAATPKERVSARVRLAKVSEHCGPDGAFVIRASSG